MSRLNRLDSVREVNVLKHSSALIRFLLACVMLGAAIGYPRLAGAAEQKIALVIGNSAYPAAPLRNPVNDATAMAAKLRALGFDVILKTNVNLRDLTRAVNQFGQKLTPGSVGLFYYAGHGLQVRGKNFLVPVDAEIDSEASVRGEAVDVDQVLDQFSASRLSMVILDACRNNPFERRFRNTAGAGLAQIDAPKGTLIAYSTAPGKTAADGTGGNGVYTEELLKALDKSGLRVEDVFKQVRINVAKVTQDQQIPWEASSLTGEFFFKPPIEKPVLAAPAPAPAPQVDPAAFEISFWDSIKASTNRAEYEAYLEQYPKGKFAGLARSRLKALEQPTLASAEQRAAFEKDRAELLKALEDERKKRDQDAEAVKREMEKLRAELLKLREDSTPSRPSVQASPTPSVTPTVAASKPAGSQAEQQQQVAIALPPARPTSAVTSPPAAEWAQRLALLEKSRGQLTFAKALAILLDLNAAEELTLLLTHEVEIKKMAWYNAYAIGTDKNGYIIWGGGRGWRRPMDASEAALEYCVRAASDVCKVIMVNGEFQQKDFLEMAKRLGGQNVAAVRQAYMQSLTKKPTESAIRISAGQMGVTSAFGFSSIRE